jgi:hypothetical protein
MVRSLLYSSGLRPVFWCVSLLHSVYLKNRLYHRSIGCTPYFAWTGVIPNLAHLCIFGSLITAAQPPEQAEEFPFALTPAIAIEGIVNFATREGVRLYTSASQKLEEEQYDCKPEGLYQFLQGP